MRFRNQSLKLLNVFQEEAKAKAEAEKTKAEAEKAEKAKKDVSDELQLINTIAPILAGRQIQGRGRQIEEGGEI